MKKIIAAWMMIAMLCFGMTAYAGAVTDSLGNMKVVNCEEWVSLRESPSTSAGRIAKVALGETVTNCTAASNGFIRCDYMGMTGYILADYLEEAAQLGRFGDPIFEAVVNGFRVRAYRGYENAGELLFVECLDPQGNQVWSRESDVTYATELDCADAFFGGTAEKPRLMLYNANEGLYALDFFTGEEIWCLTKETVDLGGSISHAVAEDGTMYIGGYYGPDPVAINMEGVVLWHGDPRHDAYWLHEIMIGEEGIIAVYDCIDEHEAAGQVTFGFDGTMLSVEWF